MKQCEILEITFIYRRRDDNFQSRMKHVFRDINDKQTEELRDYFKNLYK